MLKLLRRCIAGIVFMITLICALIIVLPDRHIKSLVINITHFLTDRQLHIGTLEFERSLSPGVRLSEVAFSNAEWASEQNLFSADSISATVDLREMFKGQLLVPDISSSELQLHLEVSENGEKNWQLSAEPATLPPLSTLTVISANAKNSLITFSDRQTDSSQRLMLDEVLLSNQAGIDNPRVQINGDVNSIPVSTTLTLQADTPGTRSFSDALSLPYALVMTAGDINVTANGQLVNVGSSELIDSDVSVSIASLSQLGEITGHPMPDIGPVNLNATLSANPDTIASTGLKIPDLQLIIADSRLQLEAQGQFTEVPFTNEGTVSLSLDVPDTDQVLSLLDVDRSLPGELSLKATVSGSGQTYDAQLQHANFTSDFIDAKLTGMISDLRNTARTDVSVKLNTPDLSIVTQLFGTQMPPEWGPITATASLQGGSGTYALNNIEATLDGNSTAYVTGSIKRLVPFDDMHLDVDVSLSTLDEVSTFTRKPLPDIGPLNGTGVVGWKDGALFLQDAKANHDSQYGIAVVTGRIGDLINFDKVRLRADVDLPNFAALDLFTGFELPDVDRVMASTNLISANTRDISARQLKVSTTLDDVTVVGTGAVESFIKPYITVDLNLESRVDTLARLNEISGKQLPELGPVKATAQLKGRGKDFTLDDINAEISDSALSGTLTSQINDLKVLDKLEFDVALQADDVAQLATRLGFESPISAPANLVTRIRIDDKNLEFSNTTVDVDGNRASADISMLHLFDNQQRPLLTGDVKLLKVDTTTLFAKSDETRDTTVNPDREDDESKALPATQTRLFSSEPLPLNVLRNDDMNIDLHIQDLTTRFLDVTDANVKIRTSGGVFSVGPFAGTVNGGQVELDATIDASKDPVAVDVNMALEKFNLARAMVFEGTELLESTGGTWATVSFTGEGNTVADILGSANGEGGFYTEDLLFQENVLSIFSSDLIDQLADALNPFSDNRKMGTQLLCSAIAFQIRDGMLRTPYGFATEANDYSVVGDGQINLRDETLEIMFNSKPKTGLGISLNRLAGLVKLQGAMTSPSLTLSEIGLLQFSASIAAAVASGGVSLLAEGLYNKHAAMSDVCAQALGNSN